MAGFERHNYSDQLHIDTPEQVELEYAVAGIGSRFVAILIDHLLQVAFYLVVILVFALVFSGSKTSAAADTLDTAGKWAVAIIIFFNFCLIWGYFALFEAFWKGQTPGKRVMKLRVIKDAGRQVTLFEALARNLIRVVDYLPGLYLVGVITMLCNKRNKRLGDMVAGTLVVHEQREEQPLFYQSSGFLTQKEFAYEAPRVVEGVGFPADAMARLKPADLVVIDTFFARALDLSVEMRAAMALRVARQMTAKMGVALPEGNPERALEAIAVGMRGMRG